LTSLKDVTGNDYVMRSVEIQSIMHLKIQEKIPSLLAYRQFPVGVFHALSVKQFYESGTFGRCSRLRWELNPLIHRSFDEVMELRGL
jgi:hypothetical protein